MAHDIFDTELDTELTLPDDVEDALRRQEEALALLERLRIAAPAGAKVSGEDARGRRDFRRWPTPEGITLELHDGAQWQSVPVLDMGIGGSRLPAVPAWMLGPAPARLKAPSCGGLLVLADIMWRDKKSGTGGLRYEFLSTEERDEWADSLLDALLARYSIG